MITILGQRKYYNNRRKLEQPYFLVKLFKKNGEVFSTAEMHINEIRQYNFKYKERNGIAIQAIEENKELLYNNFEKFIVDYSIR